jgi:hypothetical protein
VTAVWLDLGSRVSRVPPHHLPMLRLFSMFPRAAPGVALVLLRLSVAATFWTNGPRACAIHLPRWVDPGVFALALLIVGGLLTPVAAALGAIVEAVSVVCAGDFGVAALAPVAAAAALALIGPGGYSIDAWIFGRRVVVVSTETKWRSS